MSKDKKKHKRKSIRVRRQEEIDRLKEKIDELEYNLNDMHNIIDSLSLRIETLTYA